MFKNIVLMGNLDEFALNMTVEAVISEDNKSYFQSLVSNKDW